MERQRWIVTASKWDKSGELGSWAHLKLTFRKAVHKDAAKKLADHVGWDDESYHRDQVIAIKKVTGGDTRFWSGWTSEEITVTWQANLPHTDPVDGKWRDASHWYAPKFSGDLTSDAASLLRKLSKSDGAPQDVIEAAKAIPVQPVELWIYVEGELDLASPKDEAEADSDDEEEAAA